MEKSRDLDIPLMRALPPAGVPITFFDILAGLRGVLRRDSGIERFGAEICRRFDVRHCFFASSGRAALSMLLTALRQLHPDRSEVVLPAFTSFSVPSAVVNAGLRVALYDLDVVTLSPNLESLDTAITDRTLCLVVCHLYGYPCDMDAVRELAARRGIPVIDDAAQAMGAKYRGRYAGTLGDAGLFSLSRGKNISTVDGGIIVTDSKPLAEVLSRVKLPQTTFLGSFKLLIQSAALSLLLRPWLYWIPAGLPFLNLGASVFDPEFRGHAYTTFQAEVGRRMLVRLKTINTERVEKARKLSRGVAESWRWEASTVKLQNPEIQQLVQPLPDTEPVYLRLPVICRGDIPMRQDLGIVRSFPAPLNEIAGLKPHLVNDGDFPVATFLARSVVTLPTHGFVRDADVKQIIGALRCQERVRDLCEIYETKWQ